MSERASFLLRTDPKVLDALRRWARDDLRSANAQIDYLLRAALRRAGRLDGGGDEDPSPGSTRAGDAENEG